MKTQTFGQCVLRLAAAFGAVLREALSPGEIEQINAKNRIHLEAGDADICETHSHCDANELMGKAFRQTFDRPKWLPSDVEEGRCSQFDEDVDLTLESAAWSMAKASGFESVETRLRPRLDDAVLAGAVHAALNAACSVLQAYLGVKAGDFASMYWQGSESDTIKQALGDYLEAERASLLAV